MAHPLSACSLPIATAVAGLVCAGAAQAEASPYYIGLSQLFDHQSNIFRIDDGRDPSDGSSRSDTVSVTSLVGGFDKMLGRQHLTGSLALRANQYQKNDTLNNLGYGLKLGADWSTVGNVSGTVKLGSDRNLKQFSNQRPDASIVTTKNIETTTQAEATVRVGVVTRYTAELGLSHLRRDTSEDATARLNFRETAVSLGMRYQPSNLLMLGAAVKATRGEYPEYFLDTDGKYTADTFTRIALDLTGEWRPSGDSKLELRLSPGNTRYDKATTRDFTGVTGEATWVWRATGKLRLETSLIRDNGEHFAFDRPEATSSLEEESRVSTILRVQANYELTGKVLLSSALTWGHRSITEESAAVGGGTLVKSGTDRLTGLRLGAKWLPTRNIEVACNVETEHRSTNSDPTLRKAMTNNGVSCSGQFLFQ